MHWLLHLGNEINLVFHERSRLSKGKNTGFHFPPLLTRSIKGEFKV